MTSFFFCLNVARIKLIVIFVANNLSMKMYCTRQNTKKALTAQRG